MAKETSVVKMRNVLVRIEVERDANDIAVGVKTVEIGTYIVGNSGIFRDTRREVEFIGELLAENRQAGDHKGRVTDTRGTIERLYRTEDGRLIVHSEDWSHWQGEPNEYSLNEVSEAELGPTGYYWQLGAKAGLGRPLTLDEVLEEG